MTAVIIVVGISVLLVAEGIGLRNRRRGDTITAHTEARRWTYMAMLGLIFWAAAHFVFAIRVIELIGLGLGVALGYCLWDTARLRDRS